MIVWGGSDGNGFPFNTGGRYNPNTDSWTVTKHYQRTHWPKQHTAIWSGSGDDRLGWRGSKFRPV